MLFMYNMYQSFKELVSKEHPDWKHELSPGQVLEISCQLQKGDEIKAFVFALTDNSRLDIKGPIGISVHLFTKDTIDRLSDIGPAHIVIHLAKNSVKKISDTNILGTPEEVAKELTNWLSEEINRIG